MMACITHMTRGTSLRVPGLLSHIVAQHGNAPRLAAYAHSSGNRGLRVDNVCLMGTRGEGPPTIVGCVPPPRRGFAPPGRPGVSDEEFIDGQEQAEGPPSPP